MTPYTTKLCDEHFKNTIDTPIINVIFVFLLVNVYRVFYLPLNEFRK